MTGSEGPGGLSPPTRPRSSELYDSRRHSRGVGFPSCCTELVLAPPNTSDPHSYYAELGVSPSASRREIQAAARRLYRALHPDTGTDPDPERLTRIRNIVDVLLDDVARIKYDNTPSGRRLMDRVYAEELRKVVPVVPLRDVASALRPTPAAPYGRSGRYDFFAFGFRSSDPLRAQEWYHYLISEAARTEFRGQLRLMISDASRPSWSDVMSVLMVPRSWEPGPAVGAALMARVVGNPNPTNLSGVFPPPEGDVV